KFQKFKIVILVVWLLGALFFIINFWANNETSSAQTKNKQIKEIEGYRNWTKVNSTPQLMPERVAASCSLWISNGVIIDGQTNPHRDKYFTVYVNDIGRRAMLEQKNPKFPEGSVIVKEKLPDEKSRTPELLTVMIKQKKGYNPENGDWEYMVADGTGTKVEGRGNLQNCQSCHVAYQKSDYIFRTYLAGKTESKLK
ncbi:MAG TPA: cytochrome P460 family protein, partial [Pyrinomonadaceae bacterium]